MYFLQLCIHVFSPRMQPNPMRAHDVNHTIYFDALLQSSNINKLHIDTVAYMYIKFETSLDALFMIHASHTDTPT